MAPELRVVTLGLVEYREAHAMQERLRAARLAGEAPDTLLLLEHPPVYTRGRRTGAGDLPMGEDWYRAQGIDVVDADRGGRVTYHGPGQLVGYPVMQVRDVPGFVGAMERAIVTALGEEGVDARVRGDEGPAFTGVWVGERKIASIGIHLHRGVCTHGFAVNVANDLQPFEWVVPCGMQGARMTSLCAETGDAGVMRCFRKRVAFRFAQELGMRQRLVSAERAGVLAAPAPEPVPA